MSIIRTRKIFRDYIGDGNMLPKKFHENIVLPILLSIVLASVLLMTTATFFVYIRVDIPRACGALPPVLGIVRALSNYWHFLYRRTEFYGLFNDVEDVVHRRSKVNGAIYAETQERIESLLNKIWHRLIEPVSMMPLATFVLVAVHWCKGDYTVDMWSFYYDVVTPFDLNTVIRCALMVLWQAIVLRNMLKVFYLHISIFVELRMYTECAIRDIEIEIGHLDRLTQVDERKRNRMSMLERCRDIIDLHECIGRWNDELADVTNFMNLMAVVPMGLLLCASVFLFEMALGSASLSDLQMPISASTFGFATLFVLFFNGQQLHSHLLNLSDVAYQSEWHQYPDAIRRAILLLMMRAQQPFFLSMYGVIPFNHENYVQVVKSIYSAFTLLRTVKK